MRSPAHHDPLRDSESEGALADPAVVDTPPPVPKAVYFSAKQHEHGWPVVVDIDADDVARKHARDRLANPDDVENPLDAAGFSTQPPTHKDYRFTDIERAIEYAFEVEDIFETKFNADNTLVVYSGQGAHVYLLDTDREHRYDQQSRKVIVDVLTAVHDIPIDPVVTPDPRRVIRLPYSLHAGVSRIVTPIDSPDFDFRTEALPEFLPTEDTDEGADREKEEEEQRPPTDQEETRTGQRKRDAETNRAQDEQNSGEGEGEPDTQP